MPIIGDQPQATGGGSQPVNSFLWAGLLDNDDVLLGAAAILDLDPESVFVQGADLELLGDGQTVQVNTAGIYQPSLSPNVSRDAITDGLVSFFINASANGLPATIFPLEFFNFPIAPSLSADPRSGSEAGPFGVNWGSAKSGSIAVPDICLAPGYFEPGDTFQIAAAAYYSAGTATLIGAATSLLVVRLS